MTEHEWAATWKLLKAYWPTYRALEDATVMRQWRADLSSAGFSQEDRESGIKACMAGIGSKPFSFSALVPYVVAERDSRRRRHEPSIGVSHQGGAREWEAEKIREAEEYAKRYGMDDHWLGRRVAAIRTDGEWSRRVNSHDFAAKILAALGPIR